eukprot:gene21169-40835_t
MGAPLDDGSGVSAAAARRSRGAPCCVLRAVCCVLCAAVCRPPSRDAFLSNVADQLAGAEGLHRAVDACAGHARTPRRGVCAGSKAPTLLRQRCLLLSARLRVGYGACRGAVDDATHALSVARVLQPYTPSAIAACLGAMAAANARVGREEDADVARGKALWLLSLPTRSHAPHTRASCAWCAVAVRAWTASADAHRDGAVSRRELLSALRLYDETCHGADAAEALVVRVKHAAALAAAHDLRAADVVGREGWGNRGAGRTTKWSPASVLYVLLGASVWQAGDGITDPELEGEVEEDIVPSPAARPADHAPEGWLRWWRGAGGPAAGHRAGEYPLSLLSRCLQLLLAAGALAAERALAPPAPHADDGGGAVAEAAAHARDAVRIARIVFGHRHLRVADLLEVEASLLLRRRLPAAAEAACREALDLRRAFFARIAAPPPPPPAGDDADGR